MRTQQLPVGRFWIISALGPYTLRNALTCTNGVVAAVEPPLPVEAGPLRITEKAQ